ncbi:hypothetical protein BDN70DRAFT_958914 [Pholiota conissans]|uniref:ABM domain-containing protein n=1 Tax=Pholiota conissans TaxID=109636 RepID=A0A9P5ZBM9_9AGAR|nr:hypothetical protein BDN70DRAFT_958914 [Pholiota conissans]
MPAYEIIIFPASDTFAADPVAALKPAGEVFSQTEGCVSVHGGLAQEEKTGYVVITWDTTEHQHVVKNLDGNPEIISPIFGDGEKRAYHVNFFESPHNAMSMNTTEVLIMTLREGKKEEDLAQAFSVLGPKLNAEEGCAGPLAWGPTHEEPERSFYTFIGWESAKRHFEVGKQSSFQAPLASVYGAAEMKMLHVDFNRIS